MPKRVQLPNGDIGEFPDSMSNEQIESVLQKQFPAPDTKSDMQKIEEVRPVGQEPGMGPVSSFLDTTFGNIGGSVISAIHHPIKTVEGGLETTGAFLEPITPGVSPQLRQQAKSIREQFYKRPDESVSDYIGRMEGQAYAMLPFLAEEDLKGGAEDAANAAVRKVKGTAADVVRGVAGTGTKTVRDLVKETRDLNEAEKTRAEKAMKEYNVKTGERVLSNRKAAQGEAARAKADVDTTVKGSQLMTGIQKLETDTRKIVNGKYEAVRAKVGQDSFERGPISAGMDAIAKKWIRGSPEKIKEFESMTRPLKEQTPEMRLADQTAENLGYKNFADAIQNPQMRDTLSRALPPDVFQKALEGGAPKMTWNDLQGLYEELGARMSSGTLPGDVYKAVENAHEFIGKQMQEMAAKHKALGEWLDAKKSYRQFMQTFHDNTGPSGSGSPVAQALLAKDPEVAAGYFLGKSGDRAVVDLRRYSPTLADLAEEMRTSVREGEKAPRIERKESVPHPETTKAKTQKVGPEEIKAANEKKIQGREKFLSHVVMWRTLGPLIYLGSNLARGHFPSIEAGAIEVMAPAAIQAALTRVLTNPGVRDFLTRATPEQVQSIPPELRGNFPSLITEAQKRGIKISPALTKTFAATAAANRKQQ